MWFEDVKFSRKKGPPPSRGILLKMTQWIGDRAEGNLGGQELKWQGHMREGAWVPVSSPEQSRFPPATLGLNRVKLAPQKIHEILRAGQF